MPAYDNTAAPFGEAALRNQESTLVKDLLERADCLAALYADGADVDGLRLAVQRNFLFLKVGLEKPLGSPVGMAVGVTGNGLLAAEFAFVSHAFIIPKSPG